jgi:hypothetical protein
VSACELKKHDTLFAAQIPFSPCKISSSCYNKFCFTWNLFHGKNFIAARAEREKEIGLATLRKDNRALSESWKELLAKFRREFRIPENLNHYTKEDLKNAERCYITFRLGRSHRS